MLWRRNASSTLFPDGNQLLSVFTFQIYTQQDKGSFCRVYFWNKEPLPRYTYGRLNNKLGNVFRDRGYAFNITPFSNNF